jgi:hypothetical protein
MRFTRIAAFLFLISATCLVGSAQTTATPSPSPMDEAKAKLLQQSLDEVSSGATSLRLPENRAIAYSMVGDMYWQFDQKRARELFRNAGSELTSYNADVDKEEKDAAAPSGGRGGRGGQNFADMLAIAGDPRYQVIPLIAKHDAQLAMQIMLQTRRASIATAMTDAKNGTGRQGGRGAFAGGPNGNGFGGGFGGASQEIALEQQVESAAADQDPDLAVKLIKDSLSDGVSAGVLPLLQKLAKLDDKKAADLGSDVVQKVVDADMVKDTGPLRTGINFLQFAVKTPTATTDPKQFNFTDAEQKQIAEKLVSSLMAMPTSPSPNNWFTQVIPLVDKIEPDRSAVLKGRQAEILATSTQANNGRGGGGQQRQNLFGPSVTADQILAQLPSLPDAQKGTAYAALGSKIGSITDDAQAQKIIDSVSDTDARSSLQQQYDNANAARSITAGKLDDARRQIAAITDPRQRLQRYVALAVAYDKTGKEEDVATAKSLMKDARALTAGFPDTGDDLQDLMTIVGGYSVVEPETAFKIVEPGIEMMNEYVQATAVLSKFNRDRSFRNGELLFRQNGPGSSLVFRYLPQIQMLGQADFQRANSLLDRFSRPDARMILRLYILAGAMPAHPPATPDINTAAR